MSATPSICAVVPAFREGKHIFGVVTAIRRYCPAVIVVDDGSDDETADKAREAGAEVIVNEANSGKGVSLMKGCDHAVKNGYDLIITLDGDGQHDPSEIPHFVRAFESGNVDALVGNRMADTSKMPLIRIWTNRFMSWLLSRAMGQRVPDTQCGYRLYHKRVIPTLGTESARFAAESENLLQLADAGFKIGSVPIKTIYGEEKSKINPITDTIRFFSMLRKYKQRKQA